uniref:J domain-containing protein n=1 Tax=Chrysotila carterae TaxID=13221 RepID=A0A7S4BDZ6_CHRCT|mmetsp:Transcript_19676/g.42450  ORF Transcript_19676/g.42450 Transcript_19676/m.42450 type:complete len:785 (+) Transcript_19676:61-2415(+)
MAFEVFDDVAFYWFLMSVMVVVIVPMSYSFLSTVKWRAPDDWTRNLGSCKEKNDKLDHERRKEMGAKLFGWRGIGFVSSWVTFVVLLLRLTTMQGEEMYSFNPYKILQVEEGATPLEIKKSYRKMTLMYHPDKCQTPECADAFIKVTKAHDVLTDDATRENYEKYGNPDGYHGTSVTIGLPSWLTNKDNELGILVAYFVVLIVVIPVVVGFWWRNSSKFLEDGVMQATAYRFYRQVQEHTATKFMPGILASALEFCEGVPCKNQQADDLSRLHKRVAEHMVKNQGDQNNDIMKVKTLLYAHLLREEIPASLQSDMELVLEHAHRLLNGLLNIVMEQRFVTATMNVIEFSQLLTQALWFHSNMLLQLPHFDMQQVKHATRLLSSTKTEKTTAPPIERLKELGPEKRREALKTLSEEQHKDIDLYLNHFPDIEISFDAKVEDEEDVMEGDVLNLTVTVERKHLAEDPDWVDSDDEDDEPDESVFEKELAHLEEGSEEYEAKKEELMDEWRDAYFERQKKKREREKRRNPQTGELGFAAKPLRDPIAVHAPYFPFERYEQWMVLLVDVKSNKLVGYQKLSQNSRFEKVQLKFLAPKEGVVNYEIHCLCSAYIGADKKVLMKKTIKKKRVEELKKTAAELAEDEDEEEEEEDEEPEGKWYYLGGNSFGELILNIIALGIAGVMLFNFLYARGLWQKYVQPLLEWSFILISPVLNVVTAYTAPAVLWFTSNVYDFRHVAFMFENMTSTDINGTNATLSTRVMRNDTSFLNEDPFKPNLYNNPFGNRDEL